MRAGIFQAAVEGEVVVAAAEEDDNDVDSSIAAVRAVRAAPRARAADSDDGSVSSLASDSMMDCMERWVVLSCLEWIKYNSVPYRPGDKNHRGIRTRH